MSWSRTRVVGAVTTVLLATTTLAACGSDADERAAALPVRRPRGSRSR